ncbi:hypothetical protein [Saccharothrix sp. Mg75]|uniref:hypothetical protein n=1 Tax=Saccharothrix sp. Mg75 TaxID=3445357 RepID=UPI003EEA2B96
MSTTTAAANAVTATTAEPGATAEPATTAEPGTTKPCPTPAKQLSTGSGSVIARRR